MQNVAINFIYLFCLLARKSFLNWFLAVGCSILAECLTHLALFARCVCVLCARVLFRLSAISNAASHPVRGRGTRQWGIRWCSVRRCARSDWASGCHGDWPRRRLCLAREIYKSEINGLSSTLVNGSLIATAAAQKPAHFKCKLKTSVPKFAQSRRFPHPP